MQNPIDPYWGLKLARCKQALQKNQFEVFLAPDAVAAKSTVMETIIPKIKLRRAAWGDSLTLRATGILEELKQNPTVEFIETFAADVSRAEIMERRRQALLADLFLTGSNAVTETGQLVNLDMVGNRVGAITFGPEHVILLVGRNKIVTDIEAAMRRIKNYAAPLNALRHSHFKTPCRKTACCRDCHSPDRICNTWVITEKSFPIGRIKIVLINQNLGL